MKKINKILSFIVSIATLVMLPFTGCKNNGNDNTVNGVPIKESGPAYVSTYEYLYGICETPVELYPEVDNALTTEWIAHVCKSMGIKTYRIWMHISHLFTVNDDDSLTMNEEYAQRLRYVVDTLKAAGIEKFTLLTAERLHLAEDKEYGNMSVPDPTAEPEKYLRALKVEEKAYEIIAREYPDIEYFEVINEPDPETSVSINKNGFVYVPNSQEISEFAFSTEERVKVCMDINWYARRGIKKGNPNAKLMLPALCNFATSVSFLERCYQAIYSQTLPIGQEFSDTDPDNYFDVLNWHPYLGAHFGLTDNIDERWLARQNEFHDVAVKYGDAEKPVWLTEFGFSDAENPEVIGTVTQSGQTGRAPINMVKALETIKKEMPYVESICLFRITDMYNSKVDVILENTFGMFYNPDDIVNKGKPKPSAVAVARYIKESSGGTFGQADMAQLCKYYYDEFGKLPTEYDWWK